MYQYVSALARTYGENVHWEEVDASTTPINALFLQYKKLWITLTHRELPYPVALDLIELKKELYDEKKTLPEWLASIGNRGLPVTEEIPKIVRRTAKYSDLWRLGYNIDRIDQTAHPDTDMPHSEKEDLLINKVGMDMELFWEYCLVTVNGLFHRTDVGPYGLHVIDGGLSGERANRNEVGALSFIDIGRVTTHAIKPTDIMKAHPDQPLVEVLHIKTEYPLENQKVGIVIGGYLHLLDNVIDVSGEHLLTVRLNNTHLHRRYFELKKHIDLSSFELNTTSKNEDQVVVSEIVNDTNIIHWLTLSQSFIVLIDSDDLYVEKHLVEETQLPGVYLTQRTPSYPLCGALGKVYDYHPQYNDGVWRLGCHENFETNFQFETTHWSNTLSIDPSRVTTRPVEYARAHLLEIGRDL